jgi:hypothetical protein
MAESRISIDPEIAMIMMLLKCNPQVRIFLSSHFQNSKLPTSTCDYLDIEQWSIGESLFVLVTCSIHSDVCLLKPNLNLKGLQHNADVHKLLLGTAVGAASRFWGTRVQFPIGQCCGSDARIHNIPSVPGEILVVVSRLTLCSLSTRNPHGIQNYNHFASDSNIFFILSLPCYKQPFR